jgi:mono/diheme cytochrome c family protein
MTRVLILMAALVSSAFAQSGASAANGKVLFNTKFRCYSCHGFSGQNGPGAKLVPMQMTEAAFMSFVRQPRAPAPGSSPSGQQNRMPAYTAKVLTDAELRDILAYIKILPVGPDAKDIPLLKEAQP